ncbi:COX assembly mitochondrial protein homolog [Cylas formicarius]|uniref:COX assembly mitochondrial protein homolog n=1 Tax=Cylas formicarius TaxID=197179 RepID=UPI0029589D9C|nr:COX assembly mitochondrial protein homolog [Cylas formicarius]
MGNSNASVVKATLGGGPKGLGDPNDKSLRKVEIDVLVPKKMREIARTEKCVPEVAKFTECCKSTGLLMVVQCRKENANLKACLTKWYNDEDFKEHCKQEYLKERTEYRRTGISQQLKRMG